MSEGADKDMQDKTLFSSFFSKNDKKCEKLFPLNKLFAAAVLFSSYLSSNQTFEEIFLTPFMKFFQKFFFQKTVFASILTPTKIKF